MCGIVGMAGDLNATHEKVMKTLLILDTLRGLDSTGVVYVSKHDGTPKIAKQIGNPFELFDTKAFEKATSGIQKVMLGHNRAATSGAISRQNAHPFEVGPVIGVHNGTVRNKHQLADHTDFRVDSENLYHHMLKEGLPDMLSKTDGGWALVWWNKDEQSINFLRNKERPLWFANSTDAKGEDDGKIIFWASEPWMLEVALSRENINYSKPELLTVDVHFSITVGNGGKLSKAVAKKAEHTFRSPYQGYQGGYRGNYQQQQSNTPAPVQTQQEGTKTPATPAATQSGNNVIKLEDVGKNPSAFDRHYIKRKNVLFELLDKCTDKDGVEYIPCFDPQAQFKDVRLYPGAMEDRIWDFIGGEIQADVDGFVPLQGFQTGYYKLKPTSVRVLVAPENSNVDEENIEPAVWKDSTGKCYTAEEFRKKWKDCSYCASPLVFGDRNVVSTAGECFCPDCIKNPAVKEFVKH